jgi:hypothetical protein
LAGPFDGHRKFPLVLRTVAGDAPGNDLPPLGSKIFQRFHILIINVHGFIGAKSANFTSGENPFFSFILGYGHGYSPSSSASGFSGTSTGFSDPSSISSGEIRDSG